MPGMDVSINCVTTIRFCHELPSQFRKGIDDPRKDSTDTRVERPEEAGWLTTYDREIKNFVRHDWSKFGSLASGSEAEIDKDFLGNGLQG
jgi:hypothetical protein